MTNENEILGFDPSQLSVFNTEDAPKSTGNSLIYHTRPSESISDDHIYRSKIKVIYNPFNLRQSILEQQSYTLQDKDGYFSAVSSLTINDLNCPIFKAWKKCHFAKKDENYALWAQAAPEKDKDGNYVGGHNRFDKRFARYVTIQVIEDKNQPDLVGKYMFWKLPKSVWEIIDTQMNPSKEDNRAAIPVMDFLFGKAIKLTVKPGPGAPTDVNYKRQTSYVAELTPKTVACTTPTGESILNDEENAILKTYVDAIREVWESEDEQEREALTAKINADENTMKLREIYSTKVLPQIKEWCPNLIETLGYKEWDDALKARVQKWIDIILTGENPAGDEPEAVKEVAKTEENTSNAAPVQPTAAPVQPAATQADDDDDLPF